MTQAINTEDVEKTLGSIKIPPRPALLNEISAELQKPYPDTNLIAARIAKDVGLSAATLKVINSPYFGLRSKVASVPTAVQFLGLQNVQSIVTSLLLKTAIGDKGPSLERFWDASEKVARISAYIASTLPRAPRDEAYTFGLFHECGIPLLMMRFDNYKETLKIAGGDPRPMVLIEDEQHGTNHATVGYMVAKAWGLPEHLADAILRHHDPEVLLSNDNAAPGIRTLVAINYLAEYLNDVSIRMRDNLQWNAVADAVLDHLGISEVEFVELKDDIANVIQ